MLKGDRCNSPKCAMIKRNYPPGFHGPKASKIKKRTSDYGLQLAEKQKAKKQYNILEKQFKLIFQKAEKQVGNVGENFLKLLELRFDNVVYRLGLAKSRVQARQLVNHGHFTINEKRINIPSYELKKGDEIKIKKSSKNNKIFKTVEESSSGSKSNEVPGWLFFEVKELSGKVLYEPTVKDIKSNIDTQMIVEYYSR